MLWPVYLVETAFGVFALRDIAEESGHAAACYEAVAAAHGYLRRMYHTQRIGTEYIWLTKDLGSVRHIDYALILCALLASTTSSQMLLQIPNNNTSFQNLSPTPIM